MRIKWCDLFNRQIYCVVIVVYSLKMDEFLTANNLVHLKELFDGSQAQNQQSFHLYNYNSLCDPYPYSYHYSEDGKIVAVGI